MCASDHIIKLGWLILHEDSVKICGNSMAGNMMWASRLRFWAETAAYSFHHLYDARAHKWLTQKKGVLSRNMGGGKPA